MGKSVHDDILDVALDKIKEDATIMTICSQEPTTYTEAITTYKLADVTIADADFGSPANGDISGRKIQVNEQTEITIDASDTATHIAISDGDTSKLLYVTTCASQALTSGNKVSIPAWEIEIEDPT